MQLRHVYRRPLDLQAPSGIRYISESDQVFAVLDQGDYEWLLTVKGKSCGCGGKPRPNGKGQSVYEPA